MAKQKGVTNMEELILVDMDSQMVSARNLHARLEIKTKFTTWFERVCEYGFTGGKEFFPKMGETSETGGRPAIDYNMTIGMAKEVCMIQRTDEAKKIRKQLIEIEEAWNSPMQVMARAIKFADVAMAELKAHNKQLETKIEQDKPKVIFADAVSASEDAILIRDLAKLLRQNNVPIGERRFYSWLREHGYICKNGTAPTQKAMEMGLFEVVVRTVNRGDALPIETSTTKVTTKGQMYFVNKFLGRKQD
jgi:anti-repressor protein